MVQNGKKVPPVFGITVYIYSTAFTQGFIYRKYKAGACVFHACKRCLADKDVLFGNSVFFQGFLKVCPENSGCTGGFLFLEL